MTIRLYNTSECNNIYITLETSSDLFIMVGLELYFGYIPFDQKGYNIHNHIFHFEKFALNRQI